MKRVILFLLISGVFFSGCDVTKKRNKEVAATGNTWYLKNYSYSDGSANRYVFSKDGFEYFPVSPAQSSTGTYSGGTYIKKLPELPLFYRLVDNIKIAFETKADHTDTRQKGSSLIEFTENGKQVKFMLKMGSGSQQMIEKVLKEIKETR